MTRKFKIEGLAELEKDLLKLEKLSRRRAVFRKAIDDASAHIVADAKSRVKRRTGRLQDSIGISGKLNKSQAMLERESKSPTEVTRYLGTSDPKAMFTEFGTKPRKNGGWFKGTMHPGTAPKPFLRPAVDAGQDKYFENIGQEIAKQIDRQIGLQARQAARDAKKGK